MPNPETLPAWLSDADVDFYVQQFQYSGFRGGLNWYRNIDRNWELMAPYAGAAVTVPALYIAGDLDLVVSFPRMKEVIADLARYVPQLRGTIMLRAAATGRSRSVRMKSTKRSLISYMACRRRR